MERKTEGSRLILCKEFSLKFLCIVGFFPFSYCRPVRDVKIDTESVSIFIKIMQKRCGFLSLEQQNKLKTAAPKRHVTEKVQVNFLEISFFLKNSQVDA